MFRIREKEIDTRVDIALMETVFKQWDMKAQKFCGWLLVAAKKYQGSRAQEPEEAGD